MRVASAVLLAAVVAVVVAAHTAEAAKLDANNALYMKLKTGLVVIQMFEDVAPKHCQRIRELVRMGFYDGLTWHRVIDGFVAQGGDPQGTGSGGTKQMIPAEFSPRHVRSHIRGAVNMARVDGDYNSADTQFSIMYVDNHFLDERYTVWGQVLSGMEHIDAIKKGDRKSGAALDGKPDLIEWMRIAGDAAQTCHDFEDDCTKWATPGAISFNGECSANTVYMDHVCPMSCGKCSVKMEFEIPCIDTYAACTKWAKPGQVSKEGECVANQHFMRKYCRLSCDPACGKAWGVKLPAA